MARTFPIKFNSIRILPIRNITWSLQSGKTWQRQGKKLVRESEMSGNFKVDQGKMKFERFCNYKKKDFVLKKYSIISWRC